MGNRGGMWIGFKQATGPKDLNVECLGRIDWTQSEGRVTFVIQTYR